MEQGAELIQRLRLGGWLKICLNTAYFTENWKQKPNRLLSYGSHHFWVMDDGNRVMSYGNSKSKQPLKGCLDGLFP